MKMQLTVLFLILAAFGMIFVLTQKQSLSNIQSFVNEPTLAIPTGSFAPIPSPTPLPPEQQAFLEQQTVAQQLAQDPNASLSAVIKTSKGDITIVLDKQTMPFASANFYQKAKAGFYKNLTFHRVEDWVVQGGDPNGDGTGGGAVPTELNDKPFTVGAVGYAASGAMEMGQGQRISSGSQFFIVKQEALHLNGQYSNFATVTDGMQVVDQIQIGDKILDVVFQ